MSQTSDSKLLERARPLFVSGCARSGTTAFTDYLNQHQEILLCQERYRYRNRKQTVTWDLFTFERIMDFGSEETRRWFRGNRERFVEYHAELLASKDPERLKWLGDKGPFYVRNMDLLAAHNPGARFIILYRPIEEVAESWDARARDPDDPWPDERRVEAAVGIWNVAMRRTREFIGSSPAPRVLIVSYRDFFYRNEAVVPQISHFLGLRFEESTTRAWREASLGFEDKRRRKNSLSEEQQSFIEEHADRAAEAWVLDRIEKQWVEPGLYVEESREAALAVLDNIEARMWQLQRRVKELERSSARERRQSTLSVKKLRRDLARERQEHRKLNKQLRDLQGSMTWKLLNKLNRISFKN